MPDPSQLDEDTRARVEALRDAYRNVFGAGATRSREQMLVWADLVEFCRLHKPAFEPGQPDVTAMRLGRQEVILRIHDALRDREPTKHELLSSFIPQRTPDTGDDES